MTERTRAEALADAISSLDELLALREKETELLLRMRRGLEQHLKKETDHE